MRNAEKVIEDLAAAGHNRAVTLEKLDSTNALLAQLLREAQAHPEITMTDAAEAANIGRALAYKIMKSGQPDS